MELSALAFLALGIVVGFWILASSFNHRDRLPPGPPSLPIVGALLTLRQPLYKHFTKLGKKYGPFVFLKIGMVPYLVVNTADAAEQVLRVKDAEFADRPTSGRFFEIFSFGYKDMLMAPYGQTWRNLRRIAGLHLFNNRMMNTSSTFRQSQIQTACISIHDCCKSGTPVNLRAIVSEYVANSLTLALFGKKDMQLLELIDSMSALAVNLNIGELIPALDWLDLHGIHAKMKNELMPRLKSIIEKQIEEHKRRKVVAGDGFICQDFTDVLVSLEKENALDEVSIMALLIDLLAAGLDTSKATLEFAMAEVIVNPGILSRAQDELDKVVGRSRLVTEADLVNLHYIEAIVKEVLRLHTPSPLGFPHQNSKEVKLAGYRIPARTRVMINIWAIGRDDKYWTDPEVFHPERFMKDYSTVSLTGQNFNLIPFSAGRRVCTGYPFALRSISFGLATLLQAFNWCQEQGSKICLDEDNRGTMSYKLASELVAIASPRIEEQLICLI